MDGTSGAGRPARPGGAGAKAPPKAPAKAPARAGRRTQDERSADTRRRLIQAAIRCLHKSGYAATTTTLVATEAGVSRGAMFHQYATKVDLMLAVVTFVYGKEIADYHERLAAIADPAARFFALPEAMWDIMSRPAGVAVLEIMIGSRSDADLARRLGPVQHQLEIDRQTEVVRDLHEHGVAGFTPNLVMQRLIVAAIRGLTIERMFTQDPQTLSACVSQLRDMLELIYQGRFQRVTKAAPRGGTAEHKVRPGRVRQ